MASAITTAKAIALQAAIGKALGVTPAVVYSGDRAVVGYVRGSADEARARAAIETMLKKPAKPSDVSFNVVPLIAPIAIKKALPAVVGIGAVVYLLTRKKTVRGRR